MREGSGPQGPGSGRLSNPGQGHPGFTGQWHQPDWLWASVTLRRLGYPQGSVCCLSASPHPLLVAFSFLACFQHPFPRMATQVTSLVPLLTVRQEDAGAPSQTAPPPSAGRPWAPCGLCAQGLLCTDSFPPTKRPQATSQGKSGSQRSRPRVHMLTPPQMGPKVGWSAKARTQPRLARQQEDTQMPCQGAGRGLAPPSTWSRAGPWPHPGTLWAAMLLPPSGTDVGAGLLSVACFTLVTDLPGLRS